MVRLERRLPFSFRPTDERIPCDAGVDQVPARVDVAAVTPELVGRLVRALIVVVIAATVFTAAQLAVTRRYGARAAWRICAVVALGLVGWWIAWMAMAWPEMLRPLAGALYLTVTFVSVPLAAATWVINRSVARRPARGAAGHVVRGWLAFMGGVVLGLILAVIPDFIRFSRHGL